MNLLGKRCNLLPSYILNNRHEETNFIYPMRIDALNNNIMYIKTI